MGGRHYANGEQISKDVPRYMKPSSARLDLEHAERNTGHSGRFKALSTVRWQYGCWTILYHLIHNPKYGQITPALAIVLWLTGDCPAPLVLLPTPNP